MRASRRRGRTVDSEAPRRSSAFVELVQKPRLPKSPAALPDHVTLAPSELQRRSFVTRPLPCATPPVQKPQWPKRHPKGTPGTPGATNWTKSTLESRHPDLHHPSERRLQAYPTPIAHPIWIRGDLLGDWRVALAAALPAAATWWSPPVSLAGISKRAVPRLGYQEQFLLWSQQIFAVLSRLIK
ncbi:hypothetical protein N7462_001978 [Penicillium macrosclerotiorum]|uniref:uncharacterized protein n=1 Tax=Penicillium macrosclerotiorum TaxID=303699 RepID=UPI002546AF75|nr:uncharacterized protein N7462_001978 [Penicillium macrosclerotiorum]KAJ5692555.1 hypothetical protein N7462_001978 [Penicillium macrosclerotiorum]